LSKPIWFIAKHLCDIPHISLLTPAMEKNLTRIDRRSMFGEMVGHRKNRISAVYSRQGCSKAIRTV
jgi:hypothetical protein